MSARRLLLLDPAGESETAPPEFLDVAALTSASFEHHETDSLGAVGLLVLLVVRAEHGAGRQAPRRPSSDGSTALGWQVSFEVVDAETESLQATLFDALGL